MSSDEEFASSRSSASLRRVKWGLEKDEKNKDCFLVEVRRGLWRLVLRDQAIVECVRGKCEIDGHLLTQSEQFHRRYTSALAPVVRARTRRAVVRIRGDFFRIASAAEANDFGVAVSHISKSWRAAMRLAARSQITLICGPKATGKSTLCSLIANACQGAWILDCDLGQPLKGPPGFVSLRRENTDTFALRFFLGDTTPRDAPGAYTRAIEHLLRFYKMEQGPLIINTCGWVRGFGAELLSTIIRAARPQLCLVLGDCSPPLSLQNVVYLKAYQRPHYSRALATASQRRVLALAHYFLAATPNLVAATNGALADPDFIVGQAIARLPRFRASLDELRIGLVGAAGQQAISFPDAVASLPGALIGLASTTDLTEQVDESQPLIPTQLASLLPCRALALVALLDLTDNSIILILPDPSLLKDCNVLLRGTLYASAHLLYPGPQASAFPFLAANALASAPMRSRSNIIRGRKQQDTYGHESQRLSGSSRSSAKRPRLAAS